MDGYLEEANLLQAGDKGVMRLLAGRLIGQPDPVIKHLLDLLLQLGWVVGIVQLMHRHTASKTQRSFRTTRAVNFNDDDDALSSPGGGRVQKEQHGHPSSLSSNFWTFL
jgi:hypothetical protein